MGRLSGCFPEIEAWRAVWLNPVEGKRNDLIGGRIGDDIVQFCLDTDRPEKWFFPGLRPDHSYGVPI